MSKKDQKTLVMGAIGIAGPTNDGHTRITRGKKFVVVGGTEEAHAKTRETAIKIDEKLRAKGYEVSRSEFRDIVQEARDR